MEVVTIDGVKEEKRTDVIMKTIFGSNEETVKVGTVVVPPLARIPFEGVSEHAEDEYAIITRGSIITEIDGIAQRVSNGQATFIPAGEKHSAFNDGSEECEIIWFMVKK